MKKETTSSAKATPKPKVSEKKATAKKKAGSNPDTSAIKCTEVTCQSTEQVINHLPDQLTNQSVPSVSSDDLIATQPTVQSINGFPVNVLPAKLQEIVNEANATLGFPKDYIAGSMLTAMAAVIGNTHSAEAMAGWKEYAILFVALVGCPGVCKSHPLSYLMQPLIDHDAEKAAQFAEALKRYNAAMELPPKERAASGYELNPAEPRRVRFMMQDVTNEAVHRILSENPRGLILMYDELAGWVKNFNRYNSGSESEFGCRCSTTRLPCPTARAVRAVCLSAIRSYASSALYSRRCLPTSRRTTATPTASWSAYSMCSFIRHRGCVA